MILNDLPDAESMFLNPYHVVVFAPNLFESQKHITAREDWILLNARLIEDISAKAWLEELLDILSLSHIEYDGHDIINPALTVKISHTFQGGHIPVITREQWVDVNVKLISELSPANWLSRLLDILEAGNTALNV